MPEKKDPKFTLEEISFFIKVILVYGTWKVLCLFMLSSPGRKEIWQSALKKIAILDAHLTSQIMNLFGYQSYNDGIWIQIDKIHFMWLAEHCLALPAMFVFAGSMLIFKGKAKDKLWFIPLGVAAIFFINIFRLVSLGFLRAHLDEMSYQVYHRYIFLAITYGLILLMVFWWMDRTMRPEATA